jgi:hypothetical protein
MQFGRDLVFTYGPWGFVAEPRGNPRIYPLLVLVRLLVAAAFASGVALTAVTRIQRPFERCAWIVTLVLLAIPTAVAPMLLFVVSTHLRERHRRLRYFTIGLLVLSCALVIWVKFTLCMVIAALCFLATIQDLLNRRLPLMAGGVIVAALAFWILAGQSFSNLPAYFRNSLAVASSYSSAMAVSGATWPVLWGTLVCVCVLASYVISIHKTWRLFPGAVWVCLFCFLNFKQAFTRQDDYHIWWGLMDALLPGGLILLAGTGFLNRTYQFIPGRKWVTALIATLVAVPVISSVLLPAMELRTDGGRERVHDLVSKIRAVLSQATPARRLAAYQHDLEILRRKDGIQLVGGTADFFPNDLAAVFASGAVPRLRPALQGYASYNAQLTAMNAAYLESSRRPDSVLFDINPIDRNYPTLEDPLSILAYFRCYAPTGFRGKYLLLRSVACQAAPRKPLFDAEIAPGDSLTVASAAGPVWAEMEIVPNALGRLVQFALRIPPVELIVETETRQRRYRLTWESAAAGFLLSPVLDDVVSFATLYDRTLFDPSIQVRNMMVRFPPGSESFYRKYLRVRLYTLEIPERNLQKVLTPSTIRFARSVRSRLGIHGETASSPAWVIQDGHAYIQVGASSEGDLAVHGSERAMQVKFGLDNKCTDVVAPRVRVRFEVLWMAGMSAANDNSPLTANVEHGRLAEQGTPSVLRHTNSYPDPLFSKVAEARGDGASSETVTLSLPGKPGQLILRTEPEHANCLAGAWWSDLDIR